MTDLAYHPELIDFAKEQGASYQCPDCGETMFTTMDFVVKDDRPAILIELSCEEIDECGYSTRGIETMDAP